MKTELVIRGFRADDEPAVIEVWRACDLLRKWNDPHKDIARKMKVQAEMFLVGEYQGEIVATVMAGYDGLRGWLHYLGVAPQHQKKGFGRAIVAEAERLLRREGCPKINLQVRTSNQGVIDFYRSVGFSVDDVSSMGKRLIPDL